MQALAEHIVTSDKACAHAIVPHTGSTANRGIMAAGDIATSREVYVAFAFAAADLLVEVDDEVWVACSKNPIAAGSRVRIIRFDGMYLIVEKINTISGTKNP